MGRRTSLLLLAGAVAALAVIVASFTPATPQAQAQAAGCGLVVKYPSSIHANVPYTFSIKWYGVGLGDNEKVTWWVAENPNTGPASAGHPAILPLNTSFGGYLLTVRSGGARSQYHFYFHVITGNCQETFERTVKLKK